MLVLFLEQTNAQFVKTEDYKLIIQKGRIIKKGSQTFWVIPTTFTNLSKDSLKYFSMACSWQDSYLVDNKKLNIMNNICDKNFPVILKLAPNKSNTVELMLMIDNPMDASRISFKIGLILIPVTKPRLEFSPKEFLEKKNVIWSNMITM